MRWSRTFCGVLVALSLVVSLDSLLPPSPVDAKRKLVSRDSDLARQSPPIALQQNGELLIADRALRCGRMRNVLDPGLPTLGSAPPGVVVLNPHLLNRQPDAVRLFVFHHECGHHYVGASELGADCWAVNQGLRQGWLDHQAVEQVCRDFGNHPASATHPSGARRCASLRQCFANATAAAARQKSTVKQPQLVRTGGARLRSEGPTRRPGPPGTMAPTSRSSQMNRQVLHAKLDDDLIDHRERYRTR